MATVAQKFFDIVPRAHADVFETLRATADDDFLLRLAFDENRAVDASEVRAGSFPLFSDDAAPVRDFLGGALQDFLAHNFCRQRSDRLISHLVFIEYLF